MCVCTKVVKERYGGKGGRGGGCEKQKQWKVRGTEGVSRFIHLHLFFGTSSFIKIGMVMAQPAPIAP